MSPSKLTTRTPYKEWNYRILFPKNSVIWSRLTLITLCQKSIAYQSNKCSNKNWYFEIVFLFWRKTTLVEIFKRNFNKYQVLFTKKVISTSPATFQFLTVHVFLRQGVKNWCFVYFFLFHWCFLVRSLDDYKSIISIL